MYRLLASAVLLVGKNHNSDYDNMSIQFLIWMYGLHS